MAEIATPSIEAPPNDTLLRRLTRYSARALRFWEPARIAYNAVLFLVVLGNVLFRLPESRAHLTWNFVLALFLLAVLANVAYCAAYAIDLFLQLSEMRLALWTGRVVSLLVGIAFGGVLAHFWCGALFDDL